MRRDGALWFSLFSGNFQETFRKLGDILYTIKNPDHESIFKIARDNFKCGCPQNTPVGITIPKLDASAMSIEDYNYWSGESFILHIRCMRCRMKDIVYAPLDHIPVVNDKARDIIFEMLQSNGCNHQIDCIYVTDPVTEVNTTYSVIKIFNQWEYMHLCYCNRCRRVYRIYLPASCCIH